MGGCLLATKNKKWNIEICKQKAMRNVYGVFLGFAPYDWNQSVCN